MRCSKEKSGGPNLLLMSLPNFAFALGHLPHFTDTTARPSLCIGGIGGALIERRSRISLPRTH
jgi:hypothetical protein